MTWWNDIWLNESFATWMARKVVEKFNPEWDAHEQREQERHKAMLIDRLASTRQIRQPVKRPDDLANAFDGITYDKGGAVLTMFENWLGEQGFRDGVRRYLNRHAYGNAKAEDFFAALSESNPALAKSFSSFVEQPGVPRIDVALDCTTAKPELHVQQERFLPGAAVTPAPRQKWSAPVCVRYEGQASDKPFCTVLNDVRNSIALPVNTCPGWVLPNPSGVGYFLSGIDGSLLKGLVKAPLTGAEVVSLAADLSTLARSAAFSLDQVLEMAAGYAADPRPEVAKAAAEAVSGMHTAIFDANGRIQLMLWVNRHFAKRALQLGWQPREDDSDATRKLRAHLLPLATEIGGEPALRAEANKLALQWLSRKDGPQLGAMLRPLLHSAAYSGDRILLDALVAAAAASPDGGERDELFRALGSFTEPVLRQQAFDLLLSDRFDAREAVTILSTAARNPDSAPAVQQFVREHYDFLLAKLPEDYGAIMPEWGKMLCSVPERTAFQNFFQARAAKQKGGARNLAQALESIDICLANRKMQEENVRRFLATIQ
jgi:alanyl aminopeptidase